MNEGCLGLPEPTLPLGGYARAKGATTYVSTPGVIINAGTGTGSITAGRRRYYPFIVPPGAAITVTALNVEITTPAAAGKVLRLGLYTATKDWQPDRLIADTGSLPADATGVVSGLISAVLPPGNYLTAWVSDAAPNYRAMSVCIPGFGSTAALGANLAVDRIEDTASAFGPFPNPGVPWNTIANTTTSFSYVIFLTVAT